MSLIIIGASVWWGIVIHRNVTVSAPAHGGQYIEAIVGKPRLINPLLAPGTSSADRVLTRLIYGSLYTYDRNGEIERSLAESFVRSDDGKEYTVTLKENILWHDSIAFTADDVVFTFNIAKDAAYGAAGIPSPLRIAWTDITIAKVDDRTVRFTLEKPRGDFLHLLTLGILPQHVWRDIAPEEFALAEFNTKPIGLGPYEYVRSEVVAETGVTKEYVLRSNENYHLGEPFITKFTLQFYAERSDAVEAYVTGLVSGVIADKPEYINRLTAIKGVQKSIPRPSYFAVFFNTNKSVALAYDEVREALTYATDRWAIINDIFGVGAIPSRGIVLPDMEGYVEENMQPEVDIAQAESILEEKGWKKGEDGIRVREEDSTRLAFSVAVRSDQEQLVAVAQAVKAQWAKIGAEVTIDERERDDLATNLVNPREYQGFLTTHPMRWDQPALYPLWHSKEKDDPGRNYAGMQSAEADVALEALQNESDEAKRRDLYAQVQQNILVEDPAVFLFVPGFVFAHDDTVKGDTVSRVNLPQDRFTDVHLWYIKEKRALK